MIDHKYRGAVAASVLTLLLTSVLWGQGKESDDSEIVVPNAALLTERGKELTEEMRVLKRNLAAMGERHPSRPTVEAKIEAIQEQLQAWEPAYGNESNPFRAAEAMPQMNEYDLRQLVIRLNKRVELLEQRVSELEAKK
ncbi:hypothetical protein [Rhodopirellula sp. MGV]|uniref:hypothetical protein n=1 Tax=Rhodopirellula sp. MGV TaxID=2023130 RepID=UPI000B96A432|nr:hypothetical protein [Rhodopirellula sp. MGV]OYP33034.1 hypothetical protein CGZ80_19300 [Rhodopirellula sp. MGV]PNY35303.1 hypothetical protein C2E31_17380 [Rhodopirellula baltica]